MREIKFRAWDKERKEMSEPFEVLSLGIPFRDGNTRYLYFDENPLMQFTGLKDKNGKEIYEGDVVKTSLMDESEELIGNLRYSDKWAKFYLAVTNKYGVKIALDSVHVWYFADDEGDGPPKAEVIGNIYENQELLEVKP